MTFTADHSDSELNKSQNGVQTLSLSLSLSHRHTHTHSLFPSSLKCLSPSCVNHIGIKRQTLCVYFSIKKVDTYFSTTSNKLYSREIVFQITLKYCRYLWDNVTLAMIVAVPILSKAKIDPIFSNEVVNIWCCYFFRLQKVASHFKETKCAKK